MLEAPLAYKFVAATLMLAEINHCSMQLRLPMELPIKPEHVRKELVFHPTKTGFLARFDTEAYSFCFADWRLRFITNIENAKLQKPNSDDLLPQVNPPPISSPDTALLIASNWLQAIDVDVRRLQIERTASVRCWPALPSETARGAIFEITWGEPTKPSVKVTMSADHGKLLSLRLEDPAYSTRPRLLIRDLNALLSITDSEFLRFTSTERENLLWDSSCQPPSK